MKRDKLKHFYKEFPGNPDARVKALKSILEKEGLIDQKALDEILDTYQNKVGPLNGAKIVAKAWTNKKFKADLIDNTDQVLKDMDLNGRQGEHVVVVENTETVHNLIVCTLCSCYPWPLLGLPPSWYKSDAYRSRAVREPRAVLSDFNVKLPISKKVKVWDSTSEIRYLVLPQQPPSSKGLSENELVSWVTRDSMIGTGLPKSPKAK
tara:strand:+ start:29 stop:649 length:621 start_codon:yes stop_codon:yes gene_type:complete